MESARHIAQQVLGSAGSGTGHCQGLSSQGDAAARLDALVECWSASVSDVKRGKLFSAACVMHC